jgi:putative endonuclease
VRCVGGQLRDGAGRDRTLTRRQTGLLAESAVADFLFADGFAVLARNLRLGPLEIDIVARKRKLLAIVEVRTRAAGAWVPAFESVSRAKILRLRRAAAALWRSKSPIVRNVDRVRIDVASVSFAGGRTRIEYVPGAIG